MMYTGNNILTTTTAGIAIARFCDYQERCHQEVKDKLYRMGVRKMEADELIAELISQDLLNEERYAITVARGKFRIKNWGRIKITHYLKARNVSDYSVRKALSLIDAEEYNNKLKELFERKKETLETEIQDFRVIRDKLVRYLLQKGYEHELIQKLYI